MLFRKTTIVYCKDNTSIYLVYLDTLCGHSVYFYMLKQVVCVVIVGL
jgi:hypothetical protein